MKILRFAITLCLALLLSLQASYPEVIRSIPVQHGGRIKPLDTFARTHLLLFSEKSSLGKMDAMEWLLEMWADPVSAIDRPVFRIRNPDVISTLSLELNPDHLFSYKALSPAMQANEHSLHQLGSKANDALEPAEKQLLDLYHKIFLYSGLLTSFDGLIRDISVSNPEIATRLYIQTDKAYSYCDLSLHANEISNLAASINDSPPPAYAADLRAFIEKLNYRLMGVDTNGPALILQENPGEHVPWLDVWQVCHRPDIKLNQREILEIWHQWFKALREHSETEVTTLTENLVKNVPVSENISLELFYNKADLFYKSLYFYGFALLLLAVAALHPWKLYGRLATSSLLVGFLLHGVGLVLRMLIMGRPPVSTLYESIIFVGWIAVLGCLLLERVFKDHSGLFLAGAIGSILHFIGFRYASEGDTMGMLVAVLNSNFWLATHVVTITVGYGATFVAGMLAHVYLFKMAIKSKPEALKSFADNLAGTVLVALFFTTLGTILGGIWADQSWGRFWGWDPKENGALLIVLWLLALIHGKIAKILSEALYAWGLCLANIVVAVAWFGVNLLNVGLHSYGFTDSIAMNLGLFCLFELVFASALWIWVFLIQQRKTAIG